MNHYSEDMKSDDASAVLRKLTEDAAVRNWPNTRPQERFYEDFALLVRLSSDGWAVGLRVEFTPESWAIAEVIALPAGSQRTLPPVDTQAMQSYVETAVGRARERRRVSIEQLQKLDVNAEFIQKRFETWRNKNSPRTNVEYAALAAKYAEQIRLGNSRATATLAESVDMSPSVMAQRIKEARRRALLTPGEQGRASGTLTGLGVLYADPDFPGLIKLRAAGMTQGEIADKYGLSEALVWKGTLAEAGFDDVVPSREGAPSLSAEEAVAEILRRRRPEQ